MEDAVRMNDTVTLAPWEPWPLVIPAAVIVAAIALSIWGTRHRRKRVREIGYLGFLLAGLAGLAMAWSLSGIWDSQQRAAALVDLGYSSPTFGAGMSFAAGMRGVVPFQAIHDGDRVRGVFRPLGGDQWEVSLVEDAAD